MLKKLIALSALSILTLAACSPIDDGTNGPIDPNDPNGGTNGTDDNGTGGTDDGTDEPAGTLEVSDQDFTANQTTITVDSAQVPEGERGWVVIHADNNGSPGEVIGFKQIPGGSTNEDVSVTITKPNAITDTLYAVLHTDEGKVGTFEENVDPAITDTETSFKLNRDEPATGTQEEGTGGNQSPQGTTQGTGLYQSYKA